MDEEKTRQEEEVQARKERILDLLRKNFSSKKRKSGISAVSVVSAIRNLSIKAVRLIVALLATRSMFSFAVRGRAVCRGI